MKRHHQTVLLLSLSSTLNKSCFVNSFVPSSSITFQTIQPSQSNNYNKFKKFNTLILSHNNPIQYPKASSHLSLSETSENKNNQDEKESLSLSTKIKELLPTILENFKNKSNLSEIIAAVKSNLLEGKVGSRGEVYVAGQFALMLFILLGYVPFFQSLFSFVLGPVLFLIGLTTCLLGVAEMGSSLSPWPVPATNGTLVIDSLVFTEIRHPLYAGLLCTMCGLSVGTGSAMRLVLTLGLYLLLDVKADYEEEQLEKKYGEEWVHYKERVKGKFIPERLWKALDKVIYGKRAGTDA